jgi:hypothetical protein
MYILAAFAFVVGLVVAVRLLREPVLRGGSPKWLRPLYLWIFPPVGFYKRVGIAPVDFAKRGHFEFEYAPRYVGVYEIGVIVDRKVPMVLPSNDLGFSAVIFGQQGGKHSWSGSISSIPYPWWNVDASGFAFLRFNVPTDVPLDNPTRFVLRVDIPSASFDRDYGKASIYVSKKPEK